MCRGGGGKEGGSNHITCAGVGGGEEGGSTQGLGMTPRGLRQGTAVATCMAIVHKGIYSPTVGYRHT